MNLWLGKSLNTAEFVRQTSVRRLFRFRFFGLIIGRWQIGITKWQQEHPHD